MNNEINTTESKEIVKELISVTGAFECYMNERSSVLRPGSLCFLRALEIAIYSSGVASIQLRMMDAKTVQTFNEYCEKRYKTTTYRMYYNQFLTFIRWCKDKGYPIAPDVLPKNLERGRGRRQFAVRAFTTEELRKIKAYMPHTQRLKEIKSWLLLACDTGMRPVDLRNVPNGDISETGSEITIYRKRNKAEPRHFALSEDSLKTCKDVITGNITTHPLARLAENFREVAFRCGIPDADGITGNVGGETLLKSRADEAVKRERERFLTHMKRATEKGQGSPC